MFKRGDRVTCVIPDFLAFLVRGQDYLVSDHDGFGVQVEGFDGRVFHETRFKLVEEKKPDPEYVYFYVTRVGPAQQEGRSHAFDTLEELQKDMLDNRLSIPGEPTIWRAEKIGKATIGVTLDIKE